VPKSPAFSASRLRRSAEPTAVTPTDPAVRELVAIREIVHAFLTADRPEDVFQFALDRVSPLVGATFASVYLIDGASELMRLAAAYNWPERYRVWLGEMRVRLGFGPSGEAASERRAIEIPDVYADDELEDWQEIASELGFRALVALPLQSGNRVLGTVTFYFADTAAFTPEKKGLLRIVADQMAATAEKASFIEQLRRSNAALVETNAELERQYISSVEARRVKDEFLANISHELRTPLTAVLGYISILQEELSGPLTDRQRNDLAGVKRSSERLLELIENLLELTTLKRGGLEVQLSEFDPREVIQDAIAGAPTLPEGVRLEVQTPDGTLPQAVTDRKKIAKVVISLLSNAYKFTAGGTVTISLAIADGDMVLSVADTGIGIPADALEMVFEEFRQVDGSATRKYGGSGLGLALARRLARLLGGDIDVVSTPGAGATFTVRVPLVCALGGSSAASA
jgi:signal transduction histidine kinase